MCAMSKPGQPEDNCAGPRGGKCFLLLAAAMGIYVLGMGYKGYYWFALAPWWADTSFWYVAIALVLAAGLFWFGARLRRWLPAGLAAFLLGSQMLYARTAWGVLRGHIPWGFDHPSFMYRLKEFGEVFPFALGGYNPWWNAGTEHFVGVTSGAHGFGMLLWPLMQLWEPHVFYGAALIFWFIFAFPWLGAASVRSAGVSRSGTLCAGILMCAPSREVFLWMWHFGTVGAMTSAMMSLPVTALGYRLAVLRRGSWGTALALAVSAWLMCLWTPGVFIAAGLALGWLWNFRSWTWRSNRRLLAAGALTLLLLSPWLWTTLFPCRNVVEYVGMVLERPALPVMLEKGFRRLVTGLVETHPVVVFCGMLGLAGLVPRGLRRWMLPLLLVLGAIAGWSREWKPLSQLDRMSIPLAVVGVLPAAALCGRLLDDEGSADGQRRRRWQLAMAQGLVLATLFMGVRVVKMHYANRGPAPLRRLPAELREFADWVRAEVPAEGRLGFAGRNVHHYGGGNIAYLPVLAGREMMADDYYGFPPGTIEYFYPPAAYRRSLRRYLFFTKAYGITHWVATTPEVLDFLDAHPNQFENIRSMNVLKRRIDVYRVRDPGPVSRFLEGSGRITARENRLEVFPADPTTERVVIRYNWRGGLRCKTPGASIEPFAVDRHLRFIAVRPGGNERVEIGYRPHWAPVKPNFDGSFHH